MGTCPPFHLIWTHSGHSKSRCDSDGWYRALSVKQLKLVFIVCTLAFLPLVVKDPAVFDRTPMCQCDQHH